MNFKSANQQDQKEDLSLLCLKGGDNAPKAWKRFTTIDSPERPLTYICEEEAFDAITFVPKRDVQLTGFSVYACLVPDYPPKGDLLDEF